jgi:15-cis-phytoene synthase
VKLEECYEFCRAVQRAHSRTYYFSTRLFPPEIRRHVHALYAFTRYADEIVDDPKEGTSVEARLEALEAFEAETMAALAGEEVENPILRAFTNTARERGIGWIHLKPFMRSMKMDTHVSRYPTYEDLEEYMYGSAAVVGLMMCRIIGVEAEEALPHAGALGEAMQLSNFLRDVREDWERGRIYLPLEDLKRFGYSEEDLGTGRMNEAFIELMRFEIDRARMLYLIADEGMRYIPRGRRYPILVARHLYAAILERIEELGYDVFSSRAETTFAEKLRVAAACAVREPGGDPAPHNEPENVDRVR